MPFSHDNAGFFDRERSTDPDDAPFPRWRRRLAEAEALLAAARSDDERAETEPNG